MLTWPYVRRMYSMDILHCVCDYSARIDVHETFDQTFLSYFISIRYLHNFWDQYSEFRVLVLSYVCGFLFLYDWKFSIEINPCYVYKADYSTRFHELSLSCTRFWILSIRSLIYCSPCLWVIILVIICIYSLKYDNVIYLQIG